jgi:hypothetical protein|tara:strand:+ start:3132 stop:3518 length:387 start_codon:yes stop_codon:yes gene_type:complete
MSASFVLLWVCCIAFIMSSVTPHEEDESGDKDSGSGNFDDSSGSGNDDSRTETMGVIGISAVALVLFVAVLTAASRGVFWEYHKHTHFLGVPSSPHSQYTFAKSGNVYRSEKVPLMPSASVLWIPDGR